MTEPSIILSNLEVRGSHGETILSIENLAIEGGGIVLLVGPNGSGKTTLLETIAGIRSYNGSISVLGEPPLRARRFIGYLPAQPRVDPLARGWDIISAGLYGVGDSPSREWVEWSIRKLGVVSFLDKRFNRLSSGEQRLVCLARVLSRAPRIVLLDEPLAFLDVRNQDLALRVVREYTRLTGALAIMALHQLHLVSAGRRLLVLEGGRLVYEGDPLYVGKGLLESVYGVELVEVSVDGGRVFLALGFLGS